jgi:uncharacterized membrane protein (UPF0127 family)
VNLIRLMAAAVIFCVFGFFLFSALIESPACGCAYVSRQIRVGDIPVTVELAVTPEQRACGVSFRDSLPDNSGMLFVYPTARILSFWMKNTRISLSIAFLDSRGTIMNMMEMQPMDTTLHYRSARPARFALEMPAKWFVGKNIKVGDRVEVGTITGNAP